MQLVQDDFANLHRARSHLPQQLSENVLFIMKVKILESIKWTHRSPNYVDY